MYLCCISLWLGEEMQAQNVKLKYIAVGGF